AASARGGVGSGDKNVSQSPTSPSPPSSAATLSRVALVVPASVAPGESVQFTANAIKTDGSVENVTGASVWNSSNTRVLQIGADGVANGVAAGEAFVSARYQNRSASSNIYVLPAGTYRLNGRVTDSGVGVAGAIVTV